jgi:hypothetical protein
VLLFVALAVGWTWPLVLHLGDAIPGDPGYNFSFLWNLWWMRHVLATPGLDYFHTTYLFYPFGTTIANHPHTALPALVAATLLTHASIVTAQNVLLIGYVFANMACMYALVWTILSPTINAEAAEPAEKNTPRVFREFCVEPRQRRRAAILAAVIFGLSPYLAVHLLGHFELVAAWMLPLFALALRRAIYGGSNAAAVAAGVVLAATAYISYYYVVYLWLFTVVYLLAWIDWVSVARAQGPTTPFARRARTVCAMGTIVLAAVALVIALAAPARTPQNVLTVMWIFALGWVAAVRRPVLVLSAAASPRMQRATAVAWRLLTPFVVGSAPLLWQAAGLIVRGEYVTPYYAWRNAPHGVDLLAPLLGHPLHPLVHAASARAYAAIRATYVEGIGWIGIVPAALLIVTHAAPANERARDERRVWRIVAVAFMVWALGPFLTIGGFDTGLKLPVILARYVPIVANARMPGRAMVGVFMAIAVLIGMQLSTMPGRLRSAPMQWILVGLVVFEYWAPIRLTPLDHPEVYRTLAAAEPGGVCEVPFGIGDGLGEGVGFQDRRILFYATLHEHQLVGGYIGRMPADAPERYLRMPVVGTLLRLSAGATPPASIAVAADSSPCRYLVVNRAASSMALTQYVRGLAGTRLAGDGYRDLYRLR